MYENFVKAAAIRATRTFCQTAIATIGTAMVVSDVDWKLVLSASALAALLSLLTSVVTGLPETDYAQSMYMDMEEPLDSVEEEAVAEGDEDEEV